MHDGQKHPDMWNVAGWVLVGVGLVIVAALYVAVLVRWPVVCGWVSSVAVVAGLATWVSGRNLRAELAAARWRLDTYNGSETHEALADVGPVTGPRDDPGIEVPGFMADSGYRAPVRCADGGVCAYLGHGMPSCDDRCALVLAGDDAASAFLADARHLAPCGWSNGDTVCGDPSAGTVDWPGQGPVDLCDTHIAWAREEVER